MARAQRLRQLNLRQLRTGLAQVGAAPATAARFRDGCGQIQRSDSGGAPPAAPDQSDLGRDWATKEIGSGREALAVPKVQFPSQC